MNNKILYASVGPQSVSGMVGCGAARVFYASTPGYASQRKESFVRREAQERVRRLGEIWTGPATEVTFAWAHMIGSMRARRSRERPRNEGGP